MEGYRLRGYAARPEYRRLARADLHRIAKFRGVKIPDADGGRVADVDGGAVRVGETGSNLHGADDLRLRDGAHTDYHRAGKLTGRAGSQVGNVHWHIAAGLLVAQRDAGVRQRRLKGETAPQQERHQVVAPEIGHREILAGQFAVLIDAVGRHVGADVGAGGGDAGLDGAGVNHFQQGAGLRVALAEQQKVKGQIPGQHGQVGLHIPVGQPGGYAVIPAGADDAAQVGRGGGQSGSGHSNLLYRMAAFRRRHSVNPSILC